MVLEQLGQSISVALAKLNQAPVIDEEVLNAVLKDIARALMMADVNVRIVGQLRDNIKKRVNVEKLAAGLNKEKIIHQAVQDELVAILDSGLEDSKGPKGGDPSPHAPAPLPASLVALPSHTRHRSSELQLQHWHPLWDRFPGTTSSSSLSSPLNQDH